MAETFELTNGVPSINALCAKYAGPDGLIKIDLGSGFYKPKGFIGFDNMSATDTQVADQSNIPDVLMDLNRSPLPLHAGSCSEVRSSHFLEHSNLEHIFAETHRVLVDGGIFMFAVPYANSADGMYPGHSIFLTEKWFDENAPFQRLFRIVERRFKPSPIYLALPWWMRLIFPFERARTILFNACNEMTIVAVKR